MPRKAQAAKNGKSEKDVASAVEVSRQRSQRNANKVVTYEEVDDKSEDEYGSTSNKEFSDDSDFDTVDKKKKQKKAPVTTGKKRGRKPKKPVKEEEEDEEEDEIDDLLEEEKEKEKEKEKSDTGKGKKRPKSDDDSDEENGIEGSSKKKVATDKKMNKTDTDYSSIDFSSKKTNEDGKEWNFKISSWNIGGIKSWLKKNGLDYIKHENPDIFCLQETKCNEKKIPPESKVEGYHSYWVSSEKEGYAGVGLYSKIKPIEVTYGIDIEEHDTEGRVITAEYEKFYLVATYVPNAGRGLVTLDKRKKWDPDLRNYIKNLDSKKPVILCGDLNVAHEPIDLANPKTNTKSAGFTPEEREGMSDLLKEGFVDTFRKLYPEQTGAYTFWTYMGNARSRNTGWRLDYFIISEQLTSSLCDNIIRSEVYGSDHCPITLLLHIEDQA